MRCFLLAASFLLVLSVGSPVAGFLATGAAASLFSVVAAACSGAAAGAASLGASFLASAFLGAAFLASV